MRKDEFLAQWGRGDFEDRFWSRVQKGDGCWLWTGTITHSGYGQLSVGPRGACVRLGAHRVSYLLSRGQVDDNLFVCHRCDNPPCVNPSHLFQGSPRDNSQDSLTKGRLCVGERQVLAKLTDSDVIRMRSTYAAGGITQRELAGQFNVHKSLVSEIIRRKGWKHIP